MDKTGTLLILSLFAMVFGAYYTTTIGQFNLAFNLIILFSTIFIITFSYSIIKSSLKQPDKAWRIDIHNKKILCYLILMGIIGVLPVFLPLGNCTLNGEVMSCYQLIQADHQKDFAIWMFMYIGSQFVGGIFTGVILLAVFNEIRRKFKK